MILFIIYYILFYIVYFSLQILAVTSQLKKSEQRVLLFKEICSNSIFHSYLTLTDAIDSVLSET